MTGCLRAMAGFEYGSDCVDSGLAIVNFRPTKDLWIQTSGYDAEGGVQRLK